MQSKQTRRIGGLYIPVLYIVSLHLTCLKPNIFLVNRFTQWNALGPGIQKDSLHANELLGKDLTVEFSSSAHAEIYIYALFVYYVPRTQTGFLSGSVLYFTRHEFLKSGLVSKYILYDI